MSNMCKSFRENYGVRVFLVWACVLPDVLKPISLGLAAVKLNST